jgi:hypothetical protein
MDSKIPVPKGELPNFSILPHGLAGVHRTPDELGGKLDARVVGMQDTCSTERISATSGKSSPAERRPPVFSLGLEETAMATTHENRSAAMGERLHAAVRRAGRHPKRATTTTGPSCAVAAPLTACDL